MKKMKKKHMEELGNGDLREIMIVCTFSGCVLLYACVALIMQG
jgi:hypothetical protein